MKPPNLECPECRGSGRPIDVGGDLPKYHCADCDLSWFPPKPDDGPPPGPHDGTECAVVLTHADPESLANVHQVGAFLAGVVAGLKMRQLIEPVVIDVAETIKGLGSLPWKDEGGVTGFVVLSTSHVAIHTWPERAAARVSVWSCREFEPAFVRDFVSRCFAGTATVHDTSFALAPASDARVIPREPCSAVSPFKDVKCWREKGHTRDHHGPGDIWWS